MKKSKIKFVVLNAVRKHYSYLGGYTHTAEEVLKEIYDGIEKEYSKKHKTKRVKTKFITIPTRGEQKL